jgi:DNA polymerase-1
MRAGEAADTLAAGGVGRGDLVAVTVAPDGAGLAAGDDLALAVDDDPAALVALVEARLRPRWVWWAADTPTALAAAGVRVATCWDVAAAHRLLVGGWRADPATVWADLSDLAREDIPSPALDLFSAAAGDEGDPEEPVRPDGHLRPDWVAGGWAATPARRARWAALALDAARRQQDRAGTRSATEAARWRAAARVESTAELLGVELSADGLPLDRTTAETILASFVGPRPADENEAAAARRTRDATVLEHAPAGVSADLRSPAQVRTLLRAVGVEVPDTRSHRLEAHRRDHPLVDALLTWRKAERIATTYGYAWLDAHVGPDGRLRGQWTGSDGAAGRMTASAGLHNLPAALRPAVAAGEGMVLVRADLGQIEPRVLAAIAGDAALARATADDDLYAPVAERLAVDRGTAKVAILGALYGQTTGHGATALQGLRAAYPVAMAYLDRADRTARAGHDVRTWGGRVVRMSAAGDAGLEPAAARARAAARGRYGRNAVVQGSAAELFKLWAVLVRARSGDLGARIVLCLHDELLVHAPATEGPAVAALVADALDEAAHRWAPGAGVRFVADLRVVDRWSEAKD